MGPARILDGSSCSSLLPFADVLDDLLTSTEVARLLRIHPKHLYRLLRRGLPGHRHGRGHWRFRRDEVLAWMDAREAGATPSSSIHAELVPSSGPPPPDQARRVLLGRVGERWVAHPLGPDARRSADALVEGATPAGQVRASLLEPSASAEHNVLVAGCAPVLGLVLDRAERGLAGRAHWIACNSGTALAHLAEGSVHVAGIHLEDHQAGTDHLAVVRERLGPAARLVRLVRWTTGVAVAPAMADRSLASLLEPSVRWVLREPGAGAQAVLRRAVHRAGSSLEAVSTTGVAPEHEAVARAIEAGLAHAGPCIEPVARARGLGFVPLQEEGFDLVVTAEGLAHPDVSRLLRSIDAAPLRREVSALGFYDASALGHAA